MLQRDGAPDLNAVPIYFEPFQFLQAHCLCLFFFPRHRGRMAETGRKHRKRTGPEPDMDVSWMDMFSDGPAVPKHAGESERVPTTALARMTTTNDDPGAATRARRDAASNDSNPSSDSNNSDDDLNALLGILGNNDTDGLSNPATQNKNKKTKTQPIVPSLRDMLRDAEKVTFTADTGPRKGTTGSAKKGGSQPVAQSMRNNEASSDDTGDDTDAPKPITLQEKYESTVKRLYRPVPYDPVTDSGGGSSSSQSASDDSDSEHSAASAAQRHRIKHIHECFLCSWGDRFHDGIYGEQVNRLHAIFSLNYGRIENAALAQQLHLYFRKRIWQEGMPMLTQEIALTHIEQLHSLDPRITVGEMIRHYHRLFLTFQNEIYYSNGGFNPKAFAAMNHAGKMILSLYKSDPVKMNFYNPDLELDTKQMGRFSNIMANFSQRPQNKRLRDDTDSEGDAHSSSEKAGKRPRTEKQPQQGFFF
jgi:hypothetical protein